MMTQHPLVADYLARLTAEARRLPSDQARELIADIEEHLSTGLADGASEIDVRNALDRLGTPQELVAAAAPVVFAPSPTKRSGWFEAGAIICLVGAELLFFLVPIAAVAWIAGLVLLAMSSVWTFREKVIGFLGLGTGFLAGFGIIFASLVTFRTSSCSGTQEMAADGAPIGEATISCDSGLEWINILAITLTLGYFLFQIFALWVLIRAARKQRSQLRGELSQGSTAVG